MKVAMLVSGGVDSSVALYRLKKQGIDLRAYYLKVWLEDDAKFMGSCPWAEDLRYVRDTCAYLKIPLSIIPLQQAYYRHVVQYVLTELQQGATPSPDILCNSRIKFGAFLHAIGDSFDYVASGHYAQLRQWKNTTELLCSLDNQKDQTYFLSQLTQAQLKYLLFPVGDTVKHILREEARRNALPSSERKDSQGICFLGKITYPTFIAYYLGKQAGKIIEKKTGKILGMHHGYWFYTIGQRKGLKLGGGPWYVVKKDCTENTIYVAKEEDVHSYGCDSFFLRDTNWIPYLPKDGLLQVKIRHSPEYLEAVFQSSPRPLVVLKKPERGIAPGQYAVLYRNQACLGGGKIVLPLSE
ncbi:hypothetical protein LSH36_1091g00253 [Paralvinella palmiformis]|uniref:tRNA-5-taurinomethyluridine 2-sulfurtransferase n=1 Tax=Paralvinella palmiformis TaxID=53620 RepID=A0AAD9MSL7_9ANNE|nr:hypothetical protein LSH36_1091g00253 [Paralvinella palmiformis]